MDALTLKVTDAGRAAIVNAQNNGTAPVLVSQIGITDQAFVAAADTDALPGELKRLETFAGAAVAADTIHVTIRDDSTDVYSCRGFAMYLDDGTLFASYGQADPIGEKSAQSMFLLALDAIFTDIDAESLSFGDTNFLLSQATTEQQGIVELATDAETTTGTDTQRAVVPKSLKAALDARFGAGAPSEFIKSLLTAATALACRTELGIKLAATFDPGAGNDLDADLLDGQHGSYYRAWANLTGVPASFPPSAHQHAWADITGAPAYATRWATWDEVTGKPATFPPAPHSQGWDTITGKPDFGTASLNNTGDFVTTVYANSIGLTSTNAAEDLNAEKTELISRFSINSTTENRPPNLDFGSGLWIGSDTVSDDGFMLVSDTNPGTTFYLRANGGQGWGPWCRVWHSENLDPSAYMPKTGGAFTGAISAPNLSGNNTGDQDLSGLMPKTGGTFTGAISAPAITSLASSRTVKHDIAPCRYGLAEFLQIPWVEYRYDESITKDQRLRFGSIVEDLEPIAPELVIHRDGQVSTIEYDQFIAVIGRALQQYIEKADAERTAMAERIEKADAEREAMAERISMLELRLAALEGAR